MRSPQNSAKPLKYNVDNAIATNMKKRIYLDYNASAPLRPSAREAINDIYSNETGAYNASAVHSYGRDGRKHVEDARLNVAKLINADPNMVIFNSGATEGNNTVLHHFIRNFPHDVVFVSTIDHPSVRDAADIFKNVRTFPVDKNGMVDLDTLEKELKIYPVSLVSCMYASNETGAIQDVSKIARIAHGKGALFHCDATQTAGRIHVDMKESGIDFLTLSSHKIGGPQGVGALALGLCGQSPALLFGGGQEKQLRSGTENVAGIAGFGAAAKEAYEHLNHYQALQKWRDKMEEAILSISPEAIIHAKDVNRLPNTTFFSLPNANSQSLLMAFDLEGIAISNGSACSSGSVKPSQTLMAMGYDEKNASGGLRISLGWATKEEDIDAFIAAWTKIYQRISKK